MPPPDEMLFPAELPISAHREAIQESLRRHPVTIICGATGSGKTTQLPRMALQLGRAAEGRQIGCTQPRRLAALTVARRVAESFGQEVGGLVGCQHRFERRLSPETRIKFMTDGILLAEARRDPLLRAYDTLIIDEAHERSLNIDFLLGIIRRALPRRPELRVVVSSATLDAERFSAFFDGAPVLRVEGRGFPIAIRYRPPGEEDEGDLPRLVAGAIAALEGEPRGDILVFLTGERDIRETASLLEGRRLPDSEIIPLLAALPASEQQRAFRLSPRRRIVLATNVAETSVTIPGIRYVIDSGLARISRYSHRTQVQRLHIEAISQASANQRAGRCGRLGPGVCIRLYAEEDFARREPHTDPEILRSSLAGVILAMLDLRLGDIAAFPFLDPPAPAMVREGLRELLELGAVTHADEAGAPRLTAIGLQLARIPVEPRLARMLLAAREERVLPDALIVVAALACDEPRRRPLEAADAADACHARWQTPHSDFAALLRLWRWWEEQTRGQPQTVARRLCRDHYLSLPRMREWRDLRDQLARLMPPEPDAAGTAAAAPEGDDALHRALLSGLLGRIGQRDPEKGDYRGARGLRFALFPGSGLFRKPPAWIVAGELVDTARLYARCAARIDPAWLEAIAGPLCKRSWHSPTWDPVPGFARASERVTLFGLTIVDGRRRDYSRIDPVVSRALMIRAGLVAGAFPRPPPFLLHNLELIETLHKAEGKMRRRGQLLDEESLADFYDRRLPPDAVNAEALRRWLRQAAPAEVLALYLRADELLPDDDRATGFPDSIQVGETRLALLYRHAPGEPDDGITCTVPRAHLSALRAWRADWLVPGALPEKVRAMLAALPAKARRALGPLDDCVAACLRRLEPGRAPLAESLADALQAACGVRVNPTTWAEEVLPPHLRMNFAVVDEAGVEQAAGRDLEALLRQFGVAAAPTARAIRDTRWQADGLTSWSCGALPERVETGRAGWTLVAYPALVDGGETVALRLFPDEGAARAAHAEGLTRMLALALGRDWKPLGRTPALSRAVTAMLQAHETSATQVGEEIALAALHRAFLEGRAPPRDAESFAACLQAGRPRLAALHGELHTLVRAILGDAAELTTTLERAAGLPAAASEDLHTQLVWLVFPGFARAVPWTHLQHYPRYLAAMRLRLERLPQNPTGDAQRLTALQPWWERYVGVATATPPPRLDRVALAAYRWMIEEYRVSLFAQELRTPQPVSPQRLEAQWQRVMAP